MQKKIWTDERLEPHIFSDTTIEHLHRYAIALEYVSDKKVLDVACGEGYGTNLLSEKSKHITGLDIDNATINKATSKYKNNNIDFICGNLEVLPFENEIFDIVVCFETIEHIENYKKALLEIKRVLKPHGLLLISTPDKLNYSDNRNYQNPFHLKEFYQEEFKELINAEFKYCSLLQQEIISSSIMYSKLEHPYKLYTGTFNKISQYQPVPIFLLLIASNNELPGINNSLFNGKNIIHQMLLEKEINIKNSLSYKIGHLILWPIKKLKRFFKK